jgi:hypothetical protein
MAANGVKYGSIAGGVIIARGGSGGNGGGGKAKMAASMAAQRRGVTGGIGNKSVAAASKASVASASGKMAQITRGVRAGQRSVWRRGGGSGMAAKMKWRGEMA